MATRQIKSTRAKRQDLPRTLWLAGLGAVSLAHKRSGELVTTLATEGEQFRARSRKLAKTLVKDVRRAAADARKQVEGYVTPIRRNALRNVRELESSFNQRLSTVLDRISVPSKDELQALIGRVTGLRRTARKPVARKTTARKVAKRRTRAAA